MIFGVRLRSGSGTKGRRSIKKPRIVIGICSGGTIRTETVGSLFSAVFYVGAKTNEMPNMFLQIGGYVDLNRNKIAQEALKVKATHLMFIDGDHTFPEDAIMTLLNHKKDVIGGNYNIRREPLSGAGGSAIKMLVDGKPVSVLEPPEGLFKCWVVPTGFMLINTKVFKKLKYPYFEATIDKDGNHTTEDVDFCQKVHKAGYDIWCDSDIPLGHIGFCMY